MTLHSTIFGKPAVLVTGTVLTALVLTGCGGSSGTAASDKGLSSTSAAAAGPPAQGPHNAADIIFAKDMLPHHNQAVEMANMALSRDTDAQVQALATQIKAAQAPEIKQMTGWLVGWGQSAAVAAEAHGGHNMAGMSGGTHGMMSTDSMASLEKASGADFAKQFLAGMSRHHQGALEMAKTELASGQNAQAKKLATDIITSQTAEIATMAKLLTRF